MKHLLHVFSTFDAGGPQIRTVQLIEALGAGWCHSILPLDGRSGAADLLPRGVESSLVDPPPSKQSHVVLRRVRDILRSSAPELLLTYNWGAIEAVAAGRLSGVPVLHHEDGFLPDEAQGFKRRRVWMRRLLLPGVAGIVVPSHRLHRIATREWRLREERVHLVPNGIRVADVPPRRATREVALRVRSELGIPAQAFVIGSVGHLRGEKNPVRLVEAFAHVTDPTAHLLVVGDGPERPALEQAAVRSGRAERIHLVGHQHDPHGHYAAMDAFALSSDTEQMPVALLEAMASSLPVAATDVGDVQRMLPQSQAPYLAGLGPNATRDLGRALERLAHDRAGGEELGRRNRARVEERYGFEAMLAAYRRLYLRAARSPP